MKLYWETQELSVGCYVYVVYDSNKSVCYVHHWTPRAREFVETLCQSPEMLPKVEMMLAPGKEIKGAAIQILLD